MPTYEYQCDKEDCNSQFEVFLPMSKSDSPQSCPQCGETSHKIFTSCNFNLSGDNWPGKIERVKRQMRKRRNRVSQKQHDLKRDGAVPKLAPNVEGQRVGSWSEAKKLAKSKGKDTSGYDALIRKEKKGG